MSRRRIAVLSSLAMLGAGVAPLATGAHADGGPALAMPKAGCFDVTDPSGDASFEGKAPDDASLDITGLALESTKTDLLGFIKVAALANGPSGPDGQRFTITFTFNNHVFSLAGSSYSNGSGAIRDGIASTGEAGHTTQLGVDTPPISVGPGIVALAGDRGYKDSGLKFTWDTKNSWVLVDLPIADIEKYGGAKFNGQLSAVGAFSAYDEYEVSSTVDTTEAGNAGTYTFGWKVGTNKCFAAPPVAKKKKH
jgi:hypothetical protein